MILTSLLLLAQSGRLPVVTFHVGGIDRTAMVYMPPKTSAPAPLVFAFHGHGGGSLFSAVKFHIHTAWPEAMVIYPQGLPTALGRLDPQGTRNGWQNVKGQVNDRDLKFFDAMLSWAKKQTAIDPKRIYVMGHSNGGGFTYLLWKSYPGLFAAIAPASAFQLNLQGAEPESVLQIAGDKDELVPFRLQSRTAEGIKALDQATGKGAPYGQDCTLYKGANGHDFAFYEYDGPHAFQAESVNTIVRFFKEHPKP